MSQLVDPSGQIVVLGAKIGSGGEGIVFDVAGRPDKVAKIYHNPLTSERAAKISAMPAIGNYEIESVCAWPSSLLSQGQKPVGFLMPRVPASDELHVLHGPKSRKLKYPNATFGYLVHVALNIARAFAVLHKNGIVAGDVNERGILAGHDGTVRLIDCDSFQILTPKRAFLCDVGVPYFTPPELQGQHLRG